MRLFLSTVLVAATAAGCRFEAPGFDGTEYACGSGPELECPSGFTCVDGRCVVPAGPPDDEPDAAAVVVDAPVEPPADARPQITTLTFGERAGADRTGVAADVTLMADNPNTNVGSLEGVEIDADPLRITLMRFDLSAIPSDATVMSAELLVSLFDPLESGTFQLHRVPQSWTEAGATWNQRAPGAPWAVPGAGAPGFGGAGPIAEIAPRAVDALTIPLEVATVQAWVDAPAANFGLAWVSTSGDGRGGQLRSREYATVNERPLLRVTFQR
jgi:hypothetical protein